MPPEFFQRFHREYALTTAVSGEQREGSQSVEWMRGILEQHRDEVAVELDIAAFLLTRGAASVIGTAIDERSSLLEDGRLADALSTMLIGYIHRKRA